MKLPTLTPRDYDFLQLTAECGHVSTVQAARELFPNIDRFLRRAQRLVAAHFVTVTVTSSTEPRLYSLTRRGLSVLVRERPELDGKYRLPGALRLAGAQHRLAVIDTHLYCRALGLQRNAPLVAWYGPGSNRCTELGFDALGIRPDGIASFTAPSGVVEVAIECDRGTIALGTMEKKLRDGYAALATRGDVDALWVVCAAGPGRKATLASAVERVGLAAWARLLDLPFIQARPVNELPSREAVG